jgi:protocatechuate 3,4-dioxygenase, beta subunit
VNESRRRALLGIASTATTPFVRQIAAQPAALTPTPRDTEGPFYPVDWTGDIDGDLITVGGKRYSQGTSLLLVGRVLGTSGLPIVSARVEIWQVDATGKYRHPNDDGDMPLKRGFQGFGRVLTDPLGAYRFRTIKPVAYQSRPAHIHFRVAAKGYRELTTQMYFAGENKEGSSWGGFSREREKLTVTATPIRDDANADAKLMATFDIVLATV